MSATDIIIGETRRDYIISVRKHAVCAICYRPSVRPSVRLSHEWISQKRFRLWSCNFHRSV